MDPGYRESGYLPDKHLQYGDAGYADPQEGGGYPQGQTFDMVEINPAFPIILSIVIVIGFIAAIIACQVRKIMKVDPSEILAKE